MKVRVLFTLFGPSPPSTGQNSISQAMISGPFMIDGGVSSADRFQWGFVLPPRTIKREHTVRVENLLVHKTFDAASYLSSSANRHLSFCASLIQPLVWAGLQVLLSYSVYTSVSVYNSEPLLATVRYISLLSRYDTKYLYVPIYVRITSTGIDLACTGGMGS